MFRLNSSLDGSLDDVVLDSLFQIYEERGISGYADQHVPVVFRMQLRVAERLVVHYVELDVVSILLEVSPDYGFQNVDALFTLYDSRVESLVQQKSALRNGGVRWRLQSLQLLSVH